MLASNNYPLKVHALTNTYTFIYSCKVVSNYNFLYFKLIGYVYYKPHNPYIKKYQQGQKENKIANNALKLDTLISNSHYLSSL